MKQNFLILREIRHTDYTDSNAQSFNSIPCKNRSGFVISYRTFTALTELLSVATSYIRKSENNL